MSEPEYSEAFRQAVNAPQTGERFVFLGTIEHPDLLPGPLRINNSVFNIESRGNVFLPCFMQAKLLDQDPNRMPQAQWTVSNIRRELVVALESTTIPPSITMELVKKSDPDFVEMRLTNLELQNINYDEMVIQGDLIPKRLKSRKANDYYFTPVTAPGLFST